MFKRLLEDATDQVRITVDGEPVSVPRGETVAAALLARGDARFRGSVVSGEARGPHCMIGVCFECLVEIDGQPNRQACMTQVRDGMTVVRGSGARKVAS